SFSKTSVLFSQQALLSRTLGQLLRHAIKALLQLPKFISPPHTYWLCKLPTGNVRGRHHQCPDTSHQAMHGEPAKEPANRGKDQDHDQSTHSHQHEETWRDGKDVLH